MFLEALQRIDRQLQPLKRRRRAERLRTLLLMSTTVLADRAARIEAEQRGALDDDVFLSEFVSMAVGLLFAGLDEKPPRGWRLEDGAD